MTAWLQGVDDCGWRMMTSNFVFAELPGFYFDTEKNRYFPVPKEGAAAGKGIPADGKRPQVRA